jgi:hypothetical protein
VVYREVRGWESFEKWLSKIERLSEDVVWAAINEIPHEWYGGNISELEALAEKLLARRGKIRELIEAFGNSDRQPFPNWGLGDKLATEGWNDPRWGASIEGRVN